MKRLLLMDLLPAPGTTLNVISASASPLPTELLGDSTAGSFRSKAMVMVRARSHGRHGPHYGWAEAEGIITDGDTTTDDFP